MEKRVIEKSIENRIYSIMDKKMISEFNDSILSGL